MYRDDSQTTRDLVDMHLCRVWDRRGVTRHPFTSVRPVSDLHEWRHAVFLTPTTVAPCAENLRVMGSQRRSDRHR